MCPIFSNGWGNNMQKPALNIHFDPLLPDLWLYGIIAASLMVFLLALWKSRRGLILRVLALGALILALLNPSLLEEQREAVNDIAVVVVDRSPSQHMGKREDRTAKALDYLKQQLKNRPDLDLRVIEAPTRDTLPTETKLFDALEKTLADVPLQRRAGVILLTDGQVHDVPANPETFKQFGPVHALLSGDKNEKDRQMVILQAPTYGIVGQNVSIRYKIEDTANIGETMAAITITAPGATPDITVVPVNEEQVIDLPVEHAGQNVFELSAQILDGEITDSNNRAALIVNGVRDRLRVLLVSGQPHACGRTLRDLLTSDPGVDLVHFTILRDPNKLDATPQNELSLIAFPFRELFEVKLHEFDLVIFDRYQLNHILPENYFNNIVRYVQNGGALLEASGPSFATEDSLYNTALVSVLPGIPTGEVLKKSYLPAVTAEGKNHPVTKNLSWPGANAEGPGWGHWLRQVAIKTESGDVLMNGADDNPLLVLDRVDEGRVAQIASDHIWLWARGYDGGGPHAELLRRVVHWLMKEPELDEKALDVKADGKNITIRSQNYKRKNADIAMTKPDGSTQTITLENDTNGVLTRTIEADQLGIYGFEDAEGEEGFIVVGDLNPPELRGVKTTSDILKPMAEASGGGILWLDDHPQPALRQLANSNNYAGRDWIALRKNNDYTVTGTRDRPLMPAWLACALILGLAILGWWREGKI